MLNSEIDMIEEQNKMIESEINKHEELGQMSEMQKEVMRTELKTKIQENAEQMNEKDMQIKEVERQLSEIKQFVEQMIK